MKRLSSSDILWQCLAALFALLMLSIPFAIPNGLTDKGPGWLGLDVSWKMALNYADIHHLAWGRDVIYTYGPLAWLSTRIGWGIAAWPFILFDGFITVNFYFVFIDLFKNSRSKLTAVALILAIMLTVGQCFGTGLAWVLLFLIIWWMVKTFDDQRPVYFPFLILLTVLAFYIKMNTGLVAIGLLLAHFINLTVYRKIPPVKLLLWCGALAGVLGLSALYLNVSIISYIQNSSELIKGYNDVMYLNENHPQIQGCIYLLFVVLLLWFSYHAWLQIRAKKYQLVLYPLAAILFVFLLLKQAMLRNDIQHLYEFCSFAPLILLCGFSGTIDKKLNLLCPLIITLVVFFCITKVKPVGMSLIRRATGPWEYVKEVGEYGALQYSTQPDKRYLPKRIIRAIGNKPVDVFPWDSEYALENKLNYQPRPVFQSHMAYTAPLEQINYNYYVKHAPEYLIYNYDAIDNRYPFNDESLVNLFILNNYTLADSVTSNERLRLILRRKNNTSPLRFTLMGKKEISINDTISIGNANFIKANVQYNLAGKIRAFLYQPSNVEISYMRDDGQWFTYKTSAELLLTGLFTGALVTNDNEYLDLITGKQIHAIKTIRLITDSRYFDKTAVIEMDHVDYP